MSPWKPDASGEGEGVKRPSVLIVDDEAGIRELCKALVECEGCEALVAESGIEALSQCRDHGGVDLALLDLRMPGMDGLECARQLRRCCPGLPIIFVSGAADNDATRERLRNHAVAVLGKPFDLGDFRRSLRQALPDL